MKIKWTWAIFVPFLLIMAGLKLYQTAFMKDGSALFGMSGVYFNYFITALGAVMFILCALICAADRKTADILPPSRNVVSGLFALITALSIAGSAALDMLGMIKSGNYPLLWMINGLCGILASIGFIIAAFAMFSGKNNSKGISFVYLLPAIWSASLMIATFSEFTWLSVRANDMSVIVAYVFQTLFLFYNASALVVFNSKGSVKKNFVYGFPAVALLCVCGISALMSMASGRTSFTYANILLVCQLLFMAFYILSFLISATSRIVKKEDVQTITGEKDPISDSGESEDVHNDFRNLTDKLEEEEAYNEVTISTSAGNADEAPSDSSSTAEDESNEKNNSEGSGFGTASQMLDRLLDDLE